MTFDDLKFAPHPTRQGGIRATDSFTNGYGYSVIQADFSYGANEGLYELAVLHREDLCYDSGITDDVLGHLTEADVTALLQRIEALEPRT